jgi:hypothetical protein
MRKRMVSSLLLVGLSALAAFAAPGTGAESGPADPFEAPLGRLFDFRERVRDIHPAFETLYPVAVIDAGRFRAYEPDEAHRTYVLAAEAPDRDNIPKGVRAAVPLAFWANRVACVVTPEVFAEPGGYAIIFHEFVHCYQWETCELRLKKALTVSNKAMERKDFMWELQYPFPYGDKDFVADYGEMLRALETGEDERVLSIRRALKGRLSEDDWEYMTWQEWKEGSARYLENEIKARSGLQANRGGLKPPFTRVSFYAGGELLIRMLDRHDPGLIRDIEALYHRIGE